MRGVLGGGGLVLALACAAADDSELDRGEILALIQTERGCEWTTGLGVHARRVVRPEPCPDVVAYSDRDARVVTYDGREVTVATEPELKDRRSVPLPDVPAQWTWMEVDAEGKIHVQGRTDAQQTREGDDLVLTAGEVRRAVPGGASEGLLRAELIVQYMAPVDTLVWELTGAEVQLLADTQHFSFLKAPRGAGWPELFDRLDCPSECGWGPSDEIKALYPDAEPGASWGIGWVFGMVEEPELGARIVPPLFSCDHYDCAGRDELRRLPEFDAGLELSLNGDHLLVVGSHEARLYRHGTPLPVHVFPTTKVGWIPQDRQFRSGPLRGY